MAPSSEDLFDEAPPSIDPYEILDCEKTATEDEIKKAYRKAALKNHPGKSTRCQLNSEFKFTDASQLQTRSMRAKRPKLI